MMFAIRSMMVALGFFGVVYCLLSLLVACTWRWANLLCGNSAIGLARLLFAMRVFPLAGSAFITLAFALPAFLLLEPGTIDEDMGTLAFSVCTLLLLAAGLFRVVGAQARASRIVADWIEGAKVLDVGADGPALQAGEGVPPLLLYGISAPKVLVSEAAVALLTADELRIAVRHEIGHMRSRDNLKKLISHGAPFPGMARLERAWQEAAEFAADEAAVSNSAEAIDLAAALLKLSDLAPMQDAPAFTTGLVDLTSLVQLRVQRLLAWNDAAAPSAKLSWWRFVPLVLGTLPYTVAHYSQALLLTHKMTERFIH